jgi:alpha-L-fucosidase 2
MFDAHPPFQIDGNFGGANGILEMLLQCIDGEIELLPALPRAWATGSVRGVRARGGFELDIRWRDGLLQEAVLRGTPGGVAQVRYREVVRRVRVSKGGSVKLPVSRFA